MEKSKHPPFSFIFLHLLITTLLLVSGIKKSYSAPTIFDVGVIIDRNSWVGNISWTCMSLALEDFYATNANYTTRLSLHVRASVHDDVFSATSAAVDLLKNVQAQAIIGPQRSTQSQLLVELGNRYHVPIISLSAKNPSLSPSQNPYFFRTSWSDSSQANVIASIAEAFGWREVVPVFEDTEYGNGFVPCLIDAFEETGIEVPYRSSIPVSATKDQILIELKKLNESRTRVFLVHMRYSLGFNLFSVAKHAQMMGDGYVWIVTYGLMDIVDFYPAWASNAMQGVLGLKPYVNSSKKLQSFKVRWRKEYNKNTTLKLSEPTEFGLWAYDTVWALAMAAEGVGATSPKFVNSTSNSSTDLGRIEISVGGPKLREELLRTELNGLSGKFKLVDGQLDSKAYEIINVVNTGTNKVGFWTQKFGLSKYLNRKSDLDNNTITWPGGNKATPKGWQWPTWGKKLKVGVPVKPGFSQFMNVTKDPRTNKTIVNGYCSQVFEAALKYLSYDVDYEYEAFEDDKGNMNGTYDDLIYQVYLQKYDAVVGDVTIITNRSLYVDFTLPYTESGVSMLVPVQDQLKKNAWTFLKPWKPNLWLISGAFFIFTGLVVWLLEHRTNEQFGRNQVGTVLYFSFSTIVFAHKEQVKTNLARIVVIVWVFVVWILQSSYTASLTSMLTVQQLQPTVTNLDELIQKQDYIGYLNDSFMPGLLKRLNVNQSKLIAYNSPTEYNEALSNGSVAAIFEEIPYLKVFLSVYCDKYTMVGPTYKTAGFGFAFPKGSPLVPDISEAILKVTESDQMVTFEDQLYSNKSCSDLEDISGPSSSSLTLGSFWGLFVISGGTSLLALALHFIFFARQVSREFSNASVTEWLALLAKLYIKKDMPTQAPQNRIEDQQLDNAEADSIALNSPFQSPSSFSNVTHENAMTESDDNDDEDDTAITLTDGEGTPGREIGDQHTGSPSFSHW